MEKEFTSTGDNGSISPALEADVAIGSADAVPLDGIGTDSVFQALQRAILLRRLRPGTKLGEDVIAKMFDTNRMHVRKVFAHLAYRGIVTLQPNRGAFVVRPTPAEAQFVFETRRAVERACVERLIDVLTPQALERLREHNRAEQQADRGDRLAFIALSGEFHMLIARLGGNPLLCKFMEELTAQTSLIIAEYEHAGSSDCSPDCHPRLVELIGAKERAAASDLMDEHLQQMWSRLDLHTHDAADELARALYVGAKPSCC